MKYTNIVSLRTYEDGSRILQINGRDVPNVQHIANTTIHDFDQPVQQVTVTFLAAQYNVLDGDAYLPPHNRPDYTTGKAPLPMVKRRGLRAWWDRVMGRR